jgi:hypothetical protein
MGKRGAAPKPTNLRVIHGKKPYRINRSEPKPRCSLLTVRSTSPMKRSRYGSAWLPDDWTKYFVELGPEDYE